MASFWNGLKATMYLIVTHLWLRSRVIDFYIGALKKEWNWIMPVFLCGMKIYGGYFHAFTKGMYIYGFTQHIMDLEYCAHYLHKDWNIYIYICEYIYMYIYVLHMLCWCAVCKIVYMCILMEIFPGYMNMNNLYLIFVQRTLICFLWNAREQVPYF